jgi:hypothetical protein
MTNKPKPRPAAKPASRRPAKKRAPAPPARKSAKGVTASPAEHRIAVAGIAIHVGYGRDRSEEFELRGTAAINVGAPDSIVRTTGVARLVSRSSAKGAGTLGYNPASLSRNLVLTLFVEDADLDLLRAVFVTGTGSDTSDPALTVWATTAGSLAPDAPATEPVVAFGYSLDFDPGPMGPR